MMEKKRYLSPVLLTGPLNPDDDENENMNYSSQGSGQDPNGGSSSNSADSFDF